MHKQKIQMKTFTVTALLSIINLANAQTGGDFIITKSTIASGGGSSNGGNFSVSSTIGQANASDSSAGGDFSLSGGFWAIGVIIPKPDEMFKDGFENTTNKQLR